MRARLSNCRTSLLFEEMGSEGADLALADAGGNIEEGVSETLLTCKRYSKHEAKVLCRHEHSALSNIVNQVFDNIPQEIEYNMCSSSHMYI